MSHVRGGLKFEIPARGTLEGGNGKFWVYLGGVGVNPGGHDVAYFQDPKKFLGFNGGDPHYEQSCWLIGWLVCSAVPIL